MTVEQKLDIKKVDDVMGGKEAWENAESMEIPNCPKKGCDSGRAFFFML